MITPCQFSSIVRTITYKRTGFPALPSFCSERLQILKIFHVSLSSRQQNLPCQPGCVFKSGIGWEAGTWMGHEFLSVTNILTCEWWCHLPCVCQRKACSRGQQSQRSMGPDTCTCRSLSWKKIPNTGAWMKWGAKGRTSKGGGESHAWLCGPQL